MAKVRISVPSEFADILAKTAKLLEQGQNVTLVPNELGQLFGNWKESKLKR